MENLLSKQQLKKGEEIIGEGMETYNVYFILSGEAWVFKKRFGKNYRVGTLKKGDIFGAIAAITKSSRSATVIAGTDIEIGLMNKEDFLIILKKLPQDIYITAARMVDKMRDIYVLNAELLLRTGKMFGLDEKEESLSTEKFNKFLEEIPETYQTMFVPLHNSLNNVFHNYTKSSEQLEKVIKDIDIIFKQILCTASDEFKQFFESTESS